MKLDLPDEDVDFVMQVLQTSPLPFNRVAPVINRIGQCIQAEVAMRQAPPVAVEQPAAS